MMAISKTVVRKTEVSRLKFFFRVHAQLSLSHVTGTMSVFEYLPIENRRIQEMKKNIHPKVRQVVFKDTSSDFSFLGTSTMDSKETIKWKDGKSYPLIRLEISSA